MYIGRILGHPSTSLCHLRPRATPGCGAMGVGHPLHLQASALYLHAAVVQRLLGHAAAVCGRVVVLVSTVEARLLFVQPRIQYQGG